MPFDKDYWSKLATDAGLPKETVEAIAGNEKLMSTLSQGYRRQDEFSRGMDEAARAKADAEAAKQAAIQNYQANVQWLEQNQHLLTKAEKADALAQQVAAYQALYGTMNGQAPVVAAPPNGNAKPADAPKYLTAEDVAASQRNLWTIMKQLERAKERYAAEFGKPMPVSMIDELEAAAQKPENANRALPDLFSEHISGQLEEHRAAQQKEREERIRAEAYQQGIAKGRTNEPSVDNPDNVSPFYARRPDPAAKAPDEGTLMKNFISELDAPRPTA